jgi:hypothetical protein
VSARCGSVHPERPLTRCARPARHGGQHGTVSGGLYWPAKPLGPKRASYREAIAWVAKNDSGGSADALDVKEVSELITAVLVADIFDVPMDRVGRDIVRYRKAHGWG